MLTFNKKTKCNKPNIPIAYFIEDDKPKKIYYTECKCKDADDKFSELETTSELIPIPFFVENQRIGPICVCSLSGGGKSTYCARLLNEIIKLDNKHVTVGEEDGLPIIVQKHKKSPLDLQGIYLITAATEADPAYDMFPPIRLDIEDAMNKATLDDFANSVVLFDDHTNQGSKERDSWVNDLKNQLLERSRKLRTHLIICNHRQRAGSKTALENIESQAFVVFYRSNKNESRKLLTNYLDFTKQQIDNLLSIDDGRFSAAYINRNPSYIITRHKIYAY